MAKLCVMFVVVLAVAHITIAREIPSTTEINTAKAVPSNKAAAGLTDQKNVMTFGGIGAYNGIGNDGLPVGGYGGGVGVGGNLPGLNGIGGIGGAVGYGGQGAPAGSFGTFNGLGGIGGAGGGAGGIPTIGFGGAGAGAGGGAGVGGGAGAFPSP